MTLNEKIFKLEKQIIILQAKVIDLTKKTEASRIKPESLNPRPVNIKNSPMPSTGTGLGRVQGRQGNLIFNNAEVSRVPFGQQPSIPTKGYNKHFHTRYAGGALDINSLELVEYENNEGIILDQYGNTVNKHSQAYWNNIVKIEKDDNGEEKISNIADNLVWDEDNKVWRFLAVYADDEE